KGACDEGREEAIKTKALCERGGLSFRRVNNDRILARLAGTTERSGKIGDSKNEKPKLKLNLANIKGRTLSTRLLRSGPKHKSK
ncbi:hypothetical protein PIB30_087203, partial [Stylosanthes scabra]|nr:hypothetical protein [Stylosanthes scabra]